LDVGSAQRHACPEVFELKDDKAYVKMDEVPDNLADTCRESA
jgi:hypothetical protein